MNPRRLDNTRDTFASLLSALALAGLCGCGPNKASLETTSEAQDEEGVAQPDVSPDRWDCGEDGLTCVGPLGIGDCVDGECGPRLGHQCYGPALMRTCDDYCESEGSVCAPYGCDGATAWGWSGEQDISNIYCLDGYHVTAFPLEVACDANLEGLVTTFRCCCEYYLGIPPP